MKKDINIDFSTKERVAQARKLTKLGMSAKQAFGVVNDVIADRLTGNKKGLRAEDISNRIKRHLGIVERRRVNSNKNQVEAWDHEGTRTPEQDNLTYKPFAALLDKETEKKILSGRGKVDKSVVSFFKKKDIPWTSTTTGKKYNTKEEIYAEAQKDIDKLGWNKRPKLDKQLTNIPTLWHPETETSAASNGGSCEISALTAMDWEKKYGKKPENLTPEQLKEFAKMSISHQNAEYEEKKNYFNSAFENIEKAKHSGLQGSRGPSMSTHLSKRFTHNSGDPVGILAALKGNRTYFGDIENSRYGHGFTITKNGDKYQIGTINSWAWPANTKRWVSTYSNSKIHIDPSELNGKDKETFEFLRDHSDKLYKNVPGLPRKEEEKKKVPKQIDPNITKARN